MDESQYFLNKADLWTWLIEGGKIVPVYGKVGSNGYIYLVDGDPVFKNGDTACDCLFSASFWMKLKP